MRLASARLGLLALALAACDEFRLAPPSAGGPDAAAATDAARLEDDARAPDAGAPDAAGDAASLGCSAATTAFFCDDFEGGRLLGARWETTALRAGALDMRASRSPPTAFRVALAAAATPAPDHLQKTLSSSPTEGLRIDLDLLVSGTGGVAFALLDGERAVALGVQGALIELSGETVTATHPFAPRLDDGGWHHVIVRLDRQNDFVSINVDGDLVLTKTKVAALPKEPTVRIAVGAVRPPAATAWTASFDDVIVSKY